MQPTQKAVRLICGFGIKRWWWNRTAINAAGECDCFFCTGKFWWKPESRALV